jgi:hypothetical protein
MEATKTKVAAGSATTGEHFYVCLDFNIDFNYEKAGEERRHSVSWDMFCFDGHKKKKKEIY